MRTPPDILLPAFVPAGSFSTVKLGVSVGQGGAWGRRMAHGQAEDAARSTEAPHLSVAVIMLSLTPPKAQQIPAPNEHPRPSGTQGAFGPPERSLRLAGGGGVKMRRHAQEHILVNGKQLFAFSKDVEFLRSSEFFSRQRFFAVAIPEPFEPNF